MTKEQKREYFRRRREEALPAYNALMSCYPFTLDDLPDEVWKDIAGYDGYQVSTFGRVKSFKQGKRMILKPALRGDYLSVDLCGNGKTKHQQIHILVARSFIPNPEDKPEVNHDDGHKFNCHVSNLYWATRAENQRHAVRTGLIKSGEDNYLAGLTNEQARYIRDNPDNLSCKELGEMFNLTATAISYIQLGKHYANVGGTIRKALKTRVPDEIREQIRADRATGNYTYIALARKYSYDYKTIWKIVHEG